MTVIGNTVQLFLLFLAVAMNYYSTSAEYIDPLPFISCIVMIPISGRMLMGHLIFMLISRSEAKKCFNIKKFKFFLFVLYFNVFKLFL